VRLLEKVWWPHPETESPTVWALPENTRELATSLKLSDPLVKTNNPSMYVLVLATKRPLRAPAGAT
jgi:hypothetical protein